MIDKEYDLSSYNNLNMNYITGGWCDGTSNHQLVTSNPFTGEEIATFKAASLDNLNDAYIALEKAQQEWSMTNPYTMSHIIEKAVQVLINCCEELIDMLVR